MNAALGDIMLPGGLARTLTEVDVSQLDRPLELLEDPAPHTRLGQQVARLKQLGLQKAAQPVRVCGRLGEKWTYACGRSYVRKIIRSHLRFCCPQCDHYVAARMFREHQLYQERLTPGMRLCGVTVRCRNAGSLSKDLIRVFEDSVVRAVRYWLQGSEGWGFKALTSFENGQLVIKGIIALGQGFALPSNRLLIPSATCVVGPRMAASAFETMLSEILEPPVIGRHGVMRADLMAAFQGGNHLRSLGIFYGLVSRKRNDKKLRLISDSQSGAAFENQQSDVRLPEPSCPSCGPSCRRVSVSTVILSELGPERALQAMEEAILNKILRQPPGEVVGLTATSWRSDER